MFCMVPMHNLWCCSKLSAHFHPPKASLPLWPGSGVLITMLDGSFFYCNGCCKFTDVWWCFFRSLQSMLPGSTLLRITSKGAELKREQRATRVLHGSQSRCFAYIYIFVLARLINVLYVHEYSSCWRFFLP